MRAATVYAARLGWAVTPLHDVSSGACSCGRPDCHAPGKHPRLKDWGPRSTSDAATVADWVERYPTGNIGIVTGERSGLWVLDVDPRNGGAQTLRRLFTQHGPFPVTPVARTGSGGAHYLFALPPGVRVKSAPIGPGYPGLDAKGEGGQIVAAPSRTLAGSYRWHTGREPWVVPLAQAPEWLLELVTAPAAAPRGPEQTFPPATPAELESVRAALEVHGPAIEGQGGDTHAYQAACIGLHEWALTIDEFEPLFQQWNRECEPPWSDADLDRFLRSAANPARPHAKPRGHRRTVDPLALAAEITAGFVYLSEADRTAQLQPAVAKLREIVTTHRVDPVVRAQIEARAIADLGVKARALALPKAHVRAVERPEGQGDWLDWGPSGPLANANNAVHRLETDKIDLWWDDFGQRIMHGTGPEARAWTDADSGALHMRAQRVWGLTTMKLSTIGEAVSAHAHARARDPLREWLGGLEWDGVGRLEEFFVRGYGARDTAYTRAVGANFIRSLVVRGLGGWGGNNKVDTMPVLEGLQGAFKSSSLQALVGKSMFTESLESPETKDFFQALQGKWLVEIAELDAFDKASVTKIKSVISRETDRFRVSYGRIPEDFPRRCVFAGTTNHDDWQRDVTGARRFWPIRCGHVDLEWIHANRVQLFAEALHDLKAGAHWWDVPQEEARAEQDQRRASDPWEELIAAHIATLQPAQLTVSEILTGPLQRPIGQFQRGDQTRVGQIMTHVFGWVRRQTSMGGARVGVYRPPG